MFLTFLGTNGQKTKLSTLIFRKNMEEILSKHFSKMAFGNDVALVVENKEIWVSRSFLRRYSPVFEALLTGEFKEKHQELIPMPDKYFSDIFEFIQCLFPCPTMKEIDIDNIFVLIPLADEYLVEDLKRRIQKFLEIYVEYLDVPKVKICVLMDILVPCANYGYYKIVRKVVEKVAMYPFYEIRSFYDRVTPTVMLMILDVKCQRISNDAANCDETPPTLFKCSHCKNQYRGDYFCCVYHQTKLSAENSFKCFACPSPSESAQLYCMYCTGSLTASVKKLKCPNCNLERQLKEINGIDPSCCKCIVRINSSLFDMFMTENV